VIDVKFPRLHDMLLFALAVYTWILVQIITGTAVRFEHFPVAPLEDASPGVR